MKNINNKQFCLSENELWDVRYKIYHTKGDGYFLFKNFIAEDLSKHLIDFWVHLLDPSISHVPFPGKEKAFYPDCPCYFRGSPTSVHKIFYNPLWSIKNIDIVTNEIAASIINLRSQIEGKAFTRESTATPGQRCSIPRIVITRNGENILPPHSDYGFDEPDPKNIDLARVQATLFMSKYAVDYTGSGFEFTMNNGKKIQCERDLNIEPGDLLVWRYNNIHEISAIHSSDDQIGFVRMIFPPELIIRKEISQ